MATRYILIRAKNLERAKVYAKMHCTLSTYEYSPERVSSVKYDKKAGLAGGVRGYKAGLTKVKTIRDYKTGLIKVKTI